MLNMKRIFALLMVASFLAAIPLAVSTSLQSPGSVTYTVEAVDYYGKPPGTPGVGKPSGDAKPSGYSLLGFKWQSLGLNLIMNPGIMDTNEFTSAIEAAAETWDAEVTGDLVSSYSVDTSAVGGDVLDYSIEILFGDLNDARIIAQCTIWYIGDTIVDFDITFNTGSYWTWGNADFNADGSVDNANVMDLQNIATHELGHGFGLGDLYKRKEVELTMYGYASEGEINKRTLEAGDIAGIQALYGA